MANDMDLGDSPAALAVAARRDSASKSLATPTSPDKPHATELAPLQSPTGTDPAVSPKIPVVTVAGDNERRTQSASDLAGRRASSPAVSSASSPRNSLTESLSRSSSFLAAAFGGTSVSLFSGVSSPSSRGDQVTIITVVYSEPGPLFVDLYSRPDGHGAFVKSFRRKADGSMGNAEACGQVRVNDMLYSINDQVVTELPFPEIIQAAKSTTFPCTLVFHSRLPPPVPSSPSHKPSPSPAKGATSTTWSTKLGQMIGDSSLKRSASFDRKSFGDAVPSPVRRPSSAASNPNTPPLHGSSVDTPSKTKHWGESIERVKNSDGVKNLFRIMGGGSKSRPEEDHDTVEAWFEHLELRLEHPINPADAGGYLDSPLVVVTTMGGNRVLGVSEDDANEFNFAWYRKTQTQDLIQIKGARDGRYHPSIDDVDTRISVRCQSKRFPDLIRVVEYSRPMVVDPAVKDMVDILLEAGAGSFSATLASNEFDSFQIKITDERVTLIKISEEEEEGGIVASAEYHAHLQVLVDPCDQLRFTLKVQELGSMLGCRPGDTCDVKKKQQLAGVSCFFLVAQNPQHRDILALLIRQFRARAVIKEDEDVARRDELNLFVDPASSLETVVPTVAPPEPVSNIRRSLIKPIGQVKTTQHQSALEELPDKSHARIADFFSLETEINANGIVAGSDPTQPSSRTASFTYPARNSIGNGTSDALDRSTFMQDRLLAQDKEITMLKDKLASMSVLVKTTEHEKAELAASLEMKDSRIELLQMRQMQLERTNLQLSVSGRELNQVRSRLAEEIKLHQACQLQLANALEDRKNASLKEQSTQTDNEVEIPESYRRAMTETQAQVEALSFASKELRRQLVATEAKLEQLQQKHDIVLSERNALRARSAELAKELKTVVGPNRSVTEVQAQLKERSQLAANLAVARAEAKRVADEMQEYKDALDSMVKQQQQSGAADKDKAATQRLVGHNTELQRLVHQLTNSLNEAREQMSAMKKINSVLVAKMQQQDPDFRGSILESPPMSPMSGTSSVHDPRFSDDEDEEDESHDQEEDDELEQKTQQTPGSTSGRY